MANNLNQCNRGVVILFAVLLTAVVLTISLGVFNITYRQLVLSSIARESEVAFAVADSARNCALYWNSPERAFDPSPSTPFGYYQYDFQTENTVLLPASGTPSSITCAGETEDFTLTDLPYNGETFRTSAFQLEFTIIDPAGGSGRDVCANVVVMKNTDTSAKQTIIRVDGYNLSSGLSDDCIPDNLNRAVERTIETIIQG